MRVTYEERQICTLPDVPIDPQTQAYVAAFMRLEMDALFIRALSGGTIEQAREAARAHLSDKDRMALAREAERVEPLRLVSGEG